MAIRPSDQKHQRVLEEQKRLRKQRAKARRLKRRAEKQQPTDPNARDRAKTEGVLWKEEWTTEKGTPYGPMTIAGRRIGLGYSKQAQWVPKSIAMDIARALNAPFMEV